MMIYVIGGPTGTGKTALATSLASHWQAPIINADVFQMYQGMDIGTNKEKEKLLPYHPFLFDHLLPTEAMTVAKYQIEVRRLLSELLPKHEHIILVGGTGLYIKASLYDFSFAPHQQLPDLTAFAAWGDDQLHHHLATLDADAAKKIHPHNRRRVLRAIAILMATGKTKTEQENRQQKAPLYPVTFVGMLPEREKLYANLDARVETMFKQGLVAEVEKLLTQYGPTPIAFQAIGYKEVMAHLQGKMDFTTTKDLIKLSTRRYAKRQITYFRHQFPMHWYPDWQTALKGLIS